MRKNLAIALAITLAMPSTSAFATAVTSTFQAKVVIQGQCLAATASILDFGTSGILATLIDATSSVQVTCTNTTPYNIGFDQGVNGASVSARKMKGGPSNELISYSIFSDAARTTNWGNTIGTDTVAATGSGTVQTYTAYGRVPVQTTPTPGTYIDTITVTVTY